MSDVIELNPKGNSFSHENVPIHGLWGVPEGFHGFSMSHRALHHTPDAGLYFGRMVVHPSSRVCSHFTWNLNRLIFCIPTDTSTVHSTHISTLSSDSPQIRIAFIIYSSADIWTFISLFKWQFNSFHLSQLQLTVQLLSMLAQLLTFQLLSWLRLWLTFLVLSSLQQTV